MLHGVKVEGPLEYKVPRARNPDLREVTLEVGGVTVLKFATAYGEEAEGKGNKSPGSECRVGTCNDMRPTNAQRVKLDGSAPIPLLFIKTEGRPVPPSSHFVDTCTVCDIRQCAVLYPKVLQLFISLVFPRSGFQSAAGQFALSVRPSIHWLISSVSRPPISSS